MTNWDFLVAELAALEQEGFLSHTRTVESAQDAWITVDGKRVLNLCANNYLGLANHPRLREAAHAAVERFGDEDGLRTAFREGKIQIAKI